MEKTFAIYNFGCKVNQEEGGALAALFAALGWRRQAEQPQLIIINTCTVTAVADKKARNLIRRLRREHPQALIAVCGCYAQRDAAEVAAIGGVDIIAGVDERRRLPQLVEERLAQTGGAPLQAVAEIGEVRQFHRIAADNLQPRARAYLKIEDGCDQFCHYCIIPHVRGPVRSLPLAQAVEQAQRLICAGHHEIVLSGIHIGAYGQDLPSGEDLPELISRLLELPGLARLRLGSIEPQQFSAPLIELFAAQERICPHLHIPLQSGCDRTLAAMGRHYTSAQYAALIERLRALRPLTAFTTDIIVGYPGESEADFAASEQFLAELQLADSHIFPYSRRSGTPAAALPQQLSQAVKAERAARLSEIAARNAQAYRRQFIGQPLDLLAEEAAEYDGRAYWRGHSANYLNLLLPAEQLSAPPPGKIIAVRGRELYDEGLIVELC